MSIIEKLLAGFVERTFKNYVTTIIGLLVIVSATLGGAASAISTSLTLYGFPVGSGLVTIAAIASGIALILAKDAGVKLPAQVGMILLMLGLSMATARPVHAQTATTASTSNALATSSDAVAFFSAGSKSVPSSWQVGNVTKVGYDLLDYGAKKTNHVYLESTVVAIPSVNLSYYGGGFALQPEISKAFKNLNANASNFNFLIDAGAGVANLGTGTTATSNIAGHAGAALKYNLTNSLTWTTGRAEALFTPGQPVRFGLSTGITAFFGKQ